MTLIFFEETIPNSSIIVDYHVSAMSDIFTSLYFDFFNLSTVFVNFYFCPSVIPRAKCSKPCVPDPIVNGTKSFNNNLLTLL